MKTSSEADLETEAEKLGQEPALGRAGGVGDVAQSQARRPEQADSLRGAGQSLIAHVDDAAHIQEHALDHGLLPRPHRPMRSS
jgi:hypothetical protein